MIRVVIDTNVFVSAVLGGRLGAVIDFWQAQRFTLVVSDEIVREYVEVLRRPKLKLAAEQIDAIAAFILQNAEFTNPVKGVAIVVADPDDDMFLEAAVAGGSTLIVSGDHHLLDLGHYQGIPIVTGRDFIERLLAEIADEPPPE